MKKINLLLVFLLSVLLFNCGGDKKKDSDKEEVKELAAEVRTKLERVRDALK